MPDEVTIHEAKTHLSHLVQRAHAGEEIVIRRGKVPMAKLMRFELGAGAARTRAGCAARSRWYPDFDDLDDEMGDLFGVGR